MATTTTRRRMTLPKMSSEVVYDGKKVRENNDSNPKHIPLNYSRILIDFIAQDSVNALDHLPISGFPVKEKINDLLYNWDFDTFKSKVGKNLSMYGSQFVYVLNDATPSNPYNIYMGEAWMSKGKSILNPDEVIISNSYYDRIERGTISQYGAVRFWKENSVVKYEIGYYDQSKSEFSRLTTTRKKDAIYTFHGITEIPGKFIRNTATATSDWERVASIMREVDTLIDDVPIEWEWIKTQIATNNNYGKDGTKSNLAGNIASGGRIHESDNVDSTLATPSGVFISGSPTLTDLVGLVNWYEDKIMKMSFTSRDNSSNGNNKHSLEVSLFNQTASQYLQTKKLQRERDWTRFFKDVVFPLINESSKGLSLKFEVSDYEQNKIERSKAEVRELNSRATFNEAKAKYEGQDKVQPAPTQNIENK